MSDTETEARRLLAAATDDAPPGIDLLDGFTAAQRRVRARRTRRFGVLSAGILAAAGAATAVTLTLSSAPPASAAVISALNSTLTQSYHLAEQDSSHYIINGRIRHPSHGTCTSEIDPVRHLLETSCSGGIFFREVGGYLYAYLPKGDSVDAGHWERMPMPSASGLNSSAINAVASATPQQMLTEIKKADKVSVVGPASGPGWTGTQYAFYTSFPAAGPTISGTVTVDKQGRARSLVLTIQTGTGNTHFVQTQSLTFSDFGAPVTVTPPPAYQTSSFP